MDINITMNGCSNFNVYTDPRDMQRYLWEHGLIKRVPGLDPDDDWIDDECWDHDGCIDVEGKADYGEHEPYDPAEDRVPDWPVRFTFTVPGKSGVGFSAARHLQAELRYLPDNDKFYYKISGDTVASRKLLRSIGCEYGQGCGWISQDYDTLKPYLDPEYKEDNEPYDATADTVPDWPVAFAFTAPGLPGPGRGYPPITDLRAELRYSPDHDKCYYKISGISGSWSEQLLAIGCTYEPSYNVTDGGGWRCYDYNLLAPYVEE